MLMENRGLLSLAFPDTLLAARGIGVGLENNGYPKCVAFKDKLNPSG